MTVYGVEVDAKLLIDIVLILVSSIIGVASYGVEKGYYGKCRYIFKMKKDFEDTLYFDKEPVYIYAQIIELGPDKIERRRPDLTREIEIYSEDRFVEVGSAFINGYYIEAPISLESSKKIQGMEKTNIYISYKGKGGVFKNKIEFKIRG